MWLRDHCPQSLHPTSYQRSIDTADIPAGIAPVTATVRGSTLRVDWPATAALPASASEFDLAWLRRHCYSAEERARRSRVGSQTRWDRSSIALPTLSFAEYAAGGEQGLRKAVAALVSHGIVMVRDMPLTPEEVMEAVKPIGVIKRTFYADHMWDTKPRSDVRV